MLGIRVHLQYEFFSKNSCVSKQRGVNIVTRRTGCEVRQTQTKCDTIGADSSPGIIYCL